MPTCLTGTGHTKEIPEVISTAAAGDALLAGVLSGLPAGIPLRNESDEDKSEINSASQLGIALASMSTTPPHTIHPKADLDTLLAFVKEKKLLISGLWGDSVWLVAISARDEKIETIIPCWQPGTDAIRSSTDGSSAVHTIFEKEPE